MQDSQGCYSEKHQSQGPNHSQRFAVGERFVASVGRIIGGISAASWIGSRTSPLALKISKDIFQPVAHLPP
jgi:hypothetical protein